MEGLFAPAILRGGSRFMRQSTSGWRVMRERLRTKPDQISEGDYALM